MGKNSMAAAIPLNFIIMTARSIYLVQQESQHLIYPSHELNGDLEVFCDQAFPIVLRDKDCFEPQLGCFCDALFDPTHTSDFSTQPYVVRYLHCLEIQVARPKL